MKEGLKPSEAPFKDGKEDEEDRSYGAAVHVHVPEEEIEDRRQQKAKHVYKSFVKPVLRGLETEASLQDVKEEMRPPYSAEEIEKALEYGISDSSLEMNDRGYLLPEDN